jgi:predicted peptidase
MIQAKGQMEAYERKVFESDAGTLPYRLLLPENFDESKSYPLLLFLHGAGEKGSDNEKQLTHGARLFLEKRAEYPAVVLFPQCAEDDYWVNADVDWERERGARLIFKDGGTPTPSMKGLLALLDDYLLRPYIDQSRVYVGGLSMGGMGTFEVVNRRPDVFAAAFPICGGANPLTAKNFVQKTKFWVFHGAKDDIVYPHLSTEMVLALINEGANPKYTLFKNANHNSWDPAFAEPELLPWIFSQRKNN